MFRLIPRDENYFDLFNTMTTELELSASLLKQFLADFARRQEYAQAIKLSEHRCDEINHAIVRKLNKSFITPIDREDIHALASALDDVLDLIDSAAVRIILFAIDQPTESAQKLADVILRATQRITKAVAAISKNSTGLEQCVAIHSLESEADDIYRQSIGQLFVNPTDPYYVIKWKEIYDVLENCVDKCDDVANVVESIILKNA